MGELPPERWEPFDDGSPEVAAALARTTRSGSFLDDVDAFDADFFEVSSREAVKMDPQQRLLLEVAWEALEHAGIPPSSLRRSQTGVFAGACYTDYGYLAALDLPGIDAWTNAGGALSIIANRLSYFLDLRGPSLTIDTACSSSIVALHLASQSLRIGDSDVALAAGVNLLLAPGIFRAFDQTGALSQTGACHAFDADADGFVRGEGCGVVVLKRLTDAVRDGDRVLAVVRGSAVNQDGRSNGLLAPNPAAQMAVLRAAYANAGVPPHEVDYVEAHGTGTLLGDPDRGARARHGLGEGTSGRVAAADRHGQDEPRPPRGGCRHRRLDQGGSRGPAREHSGESALPQPEPAHPVRPIAPESRCRATRLARHVASAAGRCVVLRLRWHQCSCGDRAGAAAVPVPREADPATTTLVVSGKTPERIASMAGGAGRVDGRRRRRGCACPTWPMRSIITGNATLSSPPSAPAIATRR